MRIDLNSDLGEGYGPWSIGDEAAMLDLVTSANLACGGHAGDPEVRFTALRRAAERGVSIGAHPGYADREGFGRRVIPMTPNEIARMVAAQVGALQGVAASLPEADQAHVVMSIDVGGTSTDIGILEAGVGHQFPLIRSIFAPQARSFSSTRS